MKRSPLERGLSAALALLFILITNREALGSGCPHHERIPHPTHHAGASPATGRDSAHHGQQVSRGADGSLPVPVECTCVGTCHAGAANPLPPSSGTERNVAAEIQDSSIPAVRDPGLALRPFVLPYATAPPRLH